MKIISIILLLISSKALAHGNIDNKYGVCTLQLAGERAVHLSAYQAKSHEGEVFCQHAPDLVETTMVLDFMEEDSKTLPFALSIDYMSAESAESLLDEPWRLYPQGSMLFNFVPRDIGRYHVRVMFMDNEGESHSRGFDFYIGKTGPNSREPSNVQQIIKWFLMILFAIGACYLFYIKRINRE